MKLAIMQPYFFPYIGYFQLLNAVEKFVFYDDVNYIKGGWINRNRLFLANAVRYITVPLKGASSFEKINQTKILLGNGWEKALLNSIFQSYYDAPYYGPVNELIECVLAGHDGSLSKLASDSVIATAQYLDINRQFVRSSSIYENSDKKSVDRVLDICRIENADEYWNLPGGRELYNTQDFTSYGVDLKFVDVSIKSYTQNTSTFHAGLSIIDVLMFNDPATVLSLMDTVAESP